ncbi:hypothetical protein ACHQM5_020308 [Ranunculus cassubicifolius]
MEVEEVRVEKRGRKRRKRENVQIVGRYVKKEFDGYGIFIGKVVSFADGLYTVDYEDGDCEDLEAHEVSAIIVDDNEFDEEFRDRRKRLDELVRKKRPVEESVSKRETRSEVMKGGSKNEGMSEAPPPKNISKREGVKVAKKSSKVEAPAPKVTLDEGMDRVEADLVAKMASTSGQAIEAEAGEEMDIDLGGYQELDDNVDADSSSDSCEFVQVRDSSFENDVPLVPPPELPCSSGNIRVPEESISHLFSVYSFLRNFSIQLYLSPFKLDDFVGSLNFNASNTLIDAVHLCLLRALRRHLEMLSTEGAERALKCLRRLDWSLLDAITWPVYLVEYLVVMGYAKGTEWQGFYSNVLNGEYYSIPVAQKLLILQILCDDVMDSAELRDEADMRVGLDEGSDINGFANPLPTIDGPRRVHPKYSKTSARKDVDAINARSHTSKSTQGSKLESKLPDLDTDTTDVDQDSNSDECQLCGMDGTLVCCDGCPSAYHARCIGMNKMLIPDGLWFCPECTAKKTKPLVRISAGLRSAEIFGVDPYEQIFMGSCNHLLVINLWTSAGPSSRYYNEMDILKVVQVLCSTEQHKSLYSGICKSIMQFWEISEDSVSSLLEKNEAEKVTAMSIKEDTQALVPLYPPELGNVVEGKNSVSSVTSTVDNGMLSGRGNDLQEVQMRSTSMETVDHGKQLLSLGDEGVSAPKPSLSADLKHSEQFGTESLVTSGSINHNTDHSDLTQQSCYEKSKGPVLATCAGGGIGDIDKKVVDDVALQKKNTALSTPREKVESKNSGGRTGEGQKTDGSVYTGELFKPQSYVNQYLLGDIAASAAANFSVLTSEEKGMAEVHTSSNPRKIVSANMAAQLKAFSTASIRFIWPNSDKKLMEVPRERCGWCLACKAPTTSRKGCLLNLAASNASKGSARHNVSIRSLKNEQGSISGIATYILYMAESLRGLFVGPFLNLSYRKQWRKEVEEASTCFSLRFSLLQLEEHIRAVAFSSDWAKFVDDWMVEASAVQNATGPVGASSKKSGGRRNKKQAVVSEVTKESGDNDKKIVRWWRGGKLSKLVFQKGILPRSIVRKAARQGGRIKISGIYYADVSELPKRSMRFAWKSAVEMSKNAPQLALQVRYLDLHLRWSDMPPLEQTSHDAKGTENSELSAYRNASICDKRVIEDKIQYGLIINQKHLPSRVTKNIIEVDKNVYEEERLWFSENNVPLSLIKDYETRVEKDLVSFAKTLPVLSKLQKQQLKAFRKDIFSYLSHREEKVDKCPCASCHNDLLLGDAVKCNVCEGYCHKGCTTSRSTVEASDDMDYEVTCKNCYRPKVLPLNEIICKTPVSQPTRPGQIFKTPVNSQMVHRQGQNHKMVMIVNRDSPKISEDQPLLESSGPHSSGPNLSSKKSRKRERSRTLTFGIIWKKKSGEASGTNFRLNNILLRSTTDIDSPLKPTCYLCFKPYNPDLMYVCCEECKFWYHADAVQLTESQIFDVVGFKCTKCRRTRSPICPYLDEEGKKRRAKDLRLSVIEDDHEVRKQRRITIKDPRSPAIEDDSVVQKQRRITIKDPRSPVFETPSVPITRPRSIRWKHANLAPTEKIEEITNVPSSSQKIQEPIIQEDDPLLFSLERVEPVSDFVSDWDTTSGPSVQGPQKLPVRRHVKPEIEIERSNQKLTVRRNNNAKIENDPVLPEVTMDFDNGGCSPPVAEWEFPMDDFENMEFEPQTYFSYGELLDDENSGLCNGYVDTWSINDKVEPGVNIPCAICSHTDPAPNCHCEVCGYGIHNWCSPWPESNWAEGKTWRCGNCRDWV